MVIMYVYSDIEFVLDLLYFPIYSHCIPSCGGTIKIIVCQTSHVETRAIVYTTICNQVEIGTLFYAHMHEHTCILMIHTQ